MRSIQNVFVSYNKMDIQSTYCQYDLTLIDSDWNGRYLLPLFYIKQHYFYRLLSFFKLNTTNYSVVFNHKDVKAIIQLNFVVNSN